MDGALAGEIPGVNGFIKEKGDIRVLLCVIAYASLLDLFELKGEDRMLL